MCVCESLEVTHCVVVFSSWGTLGSQIERMGRNWKTGPANVHTETHSHAAGWCARLCAGCGDRVNRLSPNKLVGKDGLVLTVELVC